MAITNIDGVIAGLLSPVPFLKTSVTGEAIGGFHSTAYMAGTPGAMTAPSPGLAGAALTSYAGQIQYLSSRRHNLADVVREALAAEGNSPP